MVDEDDVIQNFGRENVHTSNLQVVTGYWLKKGLWKKETYHGNKIYFLCLILKVEFAL